MNPEVAIPLPVGSAAADFQEGQVLAAGLISRPGRATAGSPGLMAVAWWALPVSPAEAAWLLTGRVVRPRDTRPRRGRVGGGIEPNLPQPDDTRPRQTNLFSPQRRRSAAEAVITRLPPA